MENASKALIIAGAILLAILLITLGIIVYRQAAGVIDNNAMDEIAVSAFNSKFEQYAGENVRGAQVNALLNTVVQNNLSNEGDSSKQVTVHVGHCSDNSELCWSLAMPGSAQYKKVLFSLSDFGKALTGISYTVKIYSDEKSGYINYIVICPAGCNQRHEL